jgi:hypothetical protein
VVLDDDDPDGADRRGRDVVHADYLPPGQSRRGHASAEPRRFTGGNPAQGSEFASFRYEGPAPHDVEVTPRHVLLEALVGASLLAMVALAALLATFVVASALTVTGARRREHRRRRLADLQHAFGALTLAELDEGLERLLATTEIERPSNLHYGHVRNSTVHRA